MSQSKNICVAQLHFYDKNQGIRLTLNIKARQ